MMLTPSFDVSQNEDCITFTIRVPHVKISEADVHFSGNSFKFYCKPYFLHLHLPGEVVESGHEVSSYDVETGTLMVRVSKRNYGEHFPDLEMLTTLLPRKQKDLKKIGEKPLIEVLEPVGGASGEGRGLIGENGQEEGEEEEFDWEVEQTFPSEANEGAELLSGLIPYGFALQHQGVFLKLQEELPSIVECPDPDHMTPHERRIGRIASEEASFNQDHYLADLMDNDYVHDLIAFQPSWKSELVKWREKIESTARSCVVALNEPGPDIVPFTAAERDKLKCLQNREYLLDKATKRSLYLGLVDIIFAYAYNFRSTEGEGSVESAWTICKLSSTLSWLEVFHGGIHEVVYCSLRRSLCYPLYRHWQLALTVLQDTRDLFRLGRRKLLQCVLDVRDILNSSEPYYILNNLYITDYATWLQRASVKQIRRVADELDEVKVEVSSLGWELVELEQAALLTVEEAGCDDKDTRGQEQLQQQHEVLTGPPNQRCVQPGSDQVSMAPGLIGGAGCSEPVCPDILCKPLIEELHVQGPGRTEVKSANEVSSGSRSEESSEAGSSDSESSSETESETCSESESACVLSNAEERTTNFVCDAAED